MSGVPWKMIQFHLIGQNKITFHCRVTVLLFVLLWHLYFFLKHYFWPDHLLKDVSHVTRYYEGKYQFFCCPWWTIKHTKRLLLKKRRTAVTPACFWHLSDLFLRCHLTLKYSLGIWQSLLSWTIPELKHCDNFFKIVRVEPRVTCIIIIIITQRDGKAVIWVFAAAAGGNRRWIWRQPLVGSRLAPLARLPRRRKETVPGRLILFALTRCSSWQCGETRVVSLGTLPVRLSCAAVWG